LPTSTAQDIYIFSLSHCEYPFAYFLKNEMYCLAVWNGKSVIGGTKRRGPIVIEKNHLLEMKKRSPSALQGRTKSEDT